MTLSKRRRALPFSGTYHPDDVEILLKPSKITHVDLAEKERLIQSGTKHYSEMLSPEKVPDARYLELYREALRRNAGRLKGDIETLAACIAARPESSAECVVISLARAGTPIGVLLKRTLTRLGITAHHYSVSIIRGRGIDANALKLIAARHGTKSAIFVDGWTGKGAIRGELIKAVPATGSGLKSFLAVVADPAGRADLAATTEDYVIPSGLLNGIVSGLISRSVLTDDLVGPNDFHACLYQTEHREHDFSQAFIDAIEAAEPHRSVIPWTPAAAREAQAACVSLIDELMAEHGVTDVNRIKPGIAEATRALLRRVPDLVLVRNLKDPEIQHLVHLAGKSGVRVMQKDLRTYRAATIIKKLRGEQE